MEVYDLDVGWQLAIGRDIVATGSIPAIDRWSVLGAGRAYHDSHWLFQVVLWLAYSAGGWIGVQGVALLFWSATSAALWKVARSRLEPAPAMLVVTVAVLACAERFLPRPEIATYAAFAWFLVFFSTREPHRPAGLARIAIVQALWTNAHGLFVLGPFVAGAHLVVALADPVDRRAALRRGLPPLVVTLLATLVSPSGLNAWRYALLLAREAGQSSAELIGSLGEMTSPFAAAARSSPAIWIFYALLASGAAAAMRRLSRRALDADMLVALACAGLACTGRRNVALFALAAVPLISDLVGGVRGSARLSLPGVRWSAAALLGALCALPLSGAYYLWMEIPARFGLGVTPSFFPHAVGPRLASGEAGLGILASNTLGGFVSLHGAPRTLPLTDGRWEIYDGSSLAEILAATRGAGGWREVVEHYRLGGLLLAHSSPEATAILPEIVRDPAWRLSHLDAAASLWLPSASGKPAPVALPSVPPRMPRFEDSILTARFAALSGSRELEITALERALVFGWREVWVLERLGAAQVAAGRYEPAEATLLELLERAPANEVALNELSFLAFRRGDPDTAERLLVRLVTASPLDTKAAENLKRVRANGTGVRGAPAENPSP